MSSKDAEHLANTVALEISGLREAMDSSLSQWSNALRVTGARPLQLSRAAVNPNLWNGNGKLAGWSLHSPGGAGTVVLRDGDGGDVVGIVALAADTSDTKSLIGVSVGQALFAQVTGPVVGVVYFLD